MGIFSMLGSLGSAVIGAQASYKSQQAANKAQAEENAKQRDWQKAENDEARAYNKMLAEQQNKWNIEQWNRENAYNTPTAQMARFGAAGLNPNLIYGQSNTAPQLSGSLTSGAPAQPTQGQFDSGIGERMSSAGRDISNQLMQIPMYAAQLDSIISQTKKTESETDILKTDAAFREALNQGQLDLQKAQINGITSDIAKNNQEIRKMRKECINLEAQSKNIIAEYDKIRSDIDYNNTNTAYIKLRSVLESKETEATLRKLSAETRLDMATTKSIVSKLSYELLGLQMDAKLTAQEIENLKKLGVQYDVSTQQMQFDFSQTKDYSDWEKSTGIWSDLMRGLSSLAIPIGIALGGASPKRIKGFGK